MVIGSTIILVFVFEGTIFRNFFCFGDCCRWGLHQSSPETHGLYFLRAGNGLAGPGKAKTYLLFSFYLLSLKWTVLFCSVLFCTSAQVPSLQRLD